MGLAVVIAKMKQAHARIRQAAPAARVAMIRQHARSIVHGLASLSPRDTNRYVRGWIIAGKMVGVGDVPLPVIKESKYKREYIEAMLAQIERLEGKVQAIDGLIWAWYEKPGRRKAGYYHKLEDRKRVAEHRVSKARDVLRRYIDRTDSIVMGVGINTRQLKGGGTRVRSWWAKDQGRQLSVTIRDRVYGGRGRLILAQHRAVLVLSNLEPHARIIERKRGVLAAADAGARLAGLRKLGSGYVRLVAAAAERRTVTTP